MAGFGHVTAAFIALATIYVVSANDCSGISDGFYPSPPDCLKFYRCAYGNKYEYPQGCHGGTLFNIDCQCCDWKSNVKCPFGSINTATTSTTITTTTTTSTRATPTTTTTTPSGGGGGSGTEGGNSTSGCAYRVCYYTNWSQYRKGAGKFLPTDIDPSLCSHIVFAFAKLDSNSHLVHVEWNDPSTDWSVGLYQQVQNLKKINPNLKTLLAVGGWEMGTTPFTTMVATNTSILSFVNHSIGFLNDNGFDGLDLDWEYPGARGSPASDKSRFTVLVKMLRVSYDAHYAETGKRLLLSAAVAAGKSNIDGGYEIPQISNDLDFISLMAYDLHGAWDGVTGHISPLYDPNSELSVDWAARYWVQQGCPKSKLIIGLPMYGRSFTLSDTTNTGLNAPISMAGAAGPYTGEGGYISYYEVCTNLAAGATVTRDPVMQVPYYVSGNQWVGYDDVASITNKVQYIKNNGYGGAMVWSLDLDDFKGTFCGEGKWPLVNAITNTCNAA